MNTEEAILALEYFLDENEDQFFELIDALKEVRLDYIVYIND